MIKVLVCGSYQGAFQLKLCQRLKKEKQEVYVLSNDPIAVKRPSAVFQDYRFSYDSESVMNVMASVSPTAVIFCGALDASYEWGRGSMPVAYVAAVMNVMACAAASKVKKFLYLSSLDIFAGNTEDGIGEMTVPIPSDQRQKAILQGEKICLSYAAEDTEVSVIRLPQVYGICGKKAENSICNKIAEAVYKGEKMDPAQECLCHLMYQDDAVDAVYKVLTGGQERQQRILHIVPKTVVETARIQDYFEALRKGNQPLPLTDQGEESRFMSAAREELGFSEKYTLEEGLIIFFSKYKDLPGRQGEKALPNKKQKGKRRLFGPLLETIAAFVLVQLFAVATSGAVFHSVIDVYLIYALIVAVVLGAIPSVLAVVLSILGKWYLLLRAASALAVFTDYESYLWILQIFSLAVLVGCLRDWYTGTVGEMGRENAYLKKEIDSLKAINDSNVQVKDVFEKRLVNYRDSYAKVYDILSRMDELEEKLVLFQAAKVVAEVMESRDVAIYAYDEKTRFCRLMASTSKAVRQKGKSFRLSVYEEVYEQLTQRKIYMNRSFEENMPMFAAGTYNGGKLEAVIMVWSMELAKVNLYQSNLLSMVAKMMERSTTRALKYMDSVRNSTHLSGTNMMEAKAFGRMLDIYCEGENEGLLEYTLLKVEGGEENREALSAILDRLTRGTDYLGVDARGQIYILLTNANEEESKGAIRRCEAEEIQVAMVKKNKGKTVGEVFPAVEFGRADTGKEPGYE
ncbi:MAG: NAD-dependent epimerase/dehydratase family protein [Lachnospiraceae bacterium]|nr:NAD-dependent epimerase/dehydratase family protein [Lachnospiraceae bacterium]